MLVGSKFVRWLSRQSNYATSSRIAKRLPRKQSSSLDVDVDLLPVVVVVGKPNVGKSALFNRLLQRAEALVKDTPGDHVTRDYRRGHGKLGDLSFQVLDTPGLEPFMARDSLQARATQLTASVLEQADAALFLVDARSGLTPADNELARWLSAHVPAPLILTANKAEHSRANGSRIQGTLTEATRLGLGEPVAISAESGEGMVDLYNRLQPILDECHQQRKERSKTAHAANSEGHTRINVAIIGLPNVGKSTLMNQLLGRERSLTGPEPGLTRDAVSDTISYEGHQIGIVDTAGWLNRGRLKGTVLGGDLAESSQLQTQHRYNRAHIVLLVVDAIAVDKRELSLTRRELALATDIIHEGRGLLIVLNKLDALPAGQRHEAIQRLGNHLQEQLPQVQGAACLGISALKGHGLEAVMPAVLQAFSVWNQRVTTSRLNKWLVKTAERYASQGGANQIMRVRYVTQVTARPPSFVAFVSGTADFSSASTKFLGNALRQEFGFKGVPLRIDVRLRKRERSQGTQRRQPQRMVL